MSIKTQLLFLIISFLSIPPLAHPLDAKNLERQESETAIPGLSYGQVEGLPIPKTIFFGAGIDNILADAPEWKNRGIDAFFVGPPTSRHGARERLTPRVDHPPGAESKR